LRREFAGFRQHRLDRVERGFGKARQVRIAVEVEHVGQQEQRVLDGGVIDGHEFLLGRTAPGLVHM
jgi:hypothetical protein